MKRLETATQYAAKLARVYRVLSRMQDRYLDYCEARGVEPTQHTFTPERSEYATVAAFWQAVADALIVGQFDTRYCGAIPPWPCSFARAGEELRQAMERLRAVASAVDMFRYLVRLEAIEAAEADTREADKVALLASDCFPY